jgi:hypothetical protein
LQEIYTKVNAIRACGIGVFYIISILALTACGDLKITPGDLDETNCHELRERLNDKALTEARVAEIKNDLAAAKCRTLLQ